MWGSWFVSESVGWFGLGWCFFGFVSLFFFPSLIRCCVCAFP